METSPVLAISCKFIITMALLCKVRLLFFLLMLLV